MRRRHPIRIGWLSRWLLQQAGVTTPEAGKLPGEKAVTAKADVIRAHGAVDRVRPDERRRAAVVEGSVNGKRLMATSAAA
jgi:hypothetical protein